MALVVRPAEVLGSSQDRWLYIMRSLATSFSGKNLPSVA
jgi:hypothetical protein